MQDRPLQLLPWRGGLLVDVELEDLKMLQWQKRLSTVETTVYKEEAADHVVRVLHSIHP